MNQTGKITAMVKIAVKNNKKHFMRFIVSFAVCIAMITASFVIYSAAQSETGIVSEEITDEPIPSDSSLLYDLIGVDGSQALEIVLLITILSVAPSILLMMTSFTRIIIVFSFLRNAMNTQSTPPNQILTGLALFLTIYIMSPVFLQINEVAYVPYTQGELTTWEAVQEASNPLKEFMLKNTKVSHLNFFVELANVTMVDADGEPLNDYEGLEIEDYEQIGLHVIIPSFMISELSRAFQMGFLLFVPFLIIDIVISSTLMSMGMMMLPPAMISLPFKIMFFVLVDGWEILVGEVIKSFNI